MEAAEDVQQNGGNESARRASNDECCGSALAQRRHRSLQAAIPSAKPRADSPSFVRVASAPVPAAQPALNPEAHRVPLRAASIAFLTVETTETLVFTAGKTP